MSEIRIILYAIIIVFGLIDYKATYEYVKLYLNWEPRQKYKNIERNPIMTILWPRIGVFYGTIIGFVFAISINYLIAFNLSFWIIGILIASQIYALWNHTKNFKILKKLCVKYPNGIPNHLIKKEI